jgi:hypothetical protein
MGSLLDARRREIAEIRRSRTKKRREQKRNRESGKVLNVGSVATPKCKVKKVVQEKEMHRLNDRMVKETETLLSGKWAVETSSNGDDGNSSPAHKNNGAVSMASTTKDTSSAVSRPLFLPPQPSRNFSPAQSGASEQHTAQNSQTETTLWGMNIPKRVRDKTLRPYERSFTSTHFVEDFSDTETSATEEDIPCSSSSEER